MKKQSVSMWLMLSMLFLPALPALAQEAAVAELSSSPAGLEWRPLAADYERAVLTVSGPSGNVIRREFESGRMPALSLFDAKGQKLADGTYQWEIRLAPRVAPGLRAQLDAARAAGDDAAIKRLQRQLPAAAVQSGSFQIHQGSIVSGGAAGATESRRDAGAAPAGPESAAKPGLSNVTAADQVIPDDLIVQGSTCVGFDCVNNESFGFDTIRLKENSTRIKFEDTSVGSFPSNDWQLTANDPPGGTANRFSIEDITGAKVPFTITAGAATNSIFLDSVGRMGLRTSTPVLDVHISTSNTPAIRLEQTSSGGFTAQTWDVAGNEANFFVRDVTGGSRLPFRIRPGAPTSSVDISADGDVGIGTASPDEKLHVLENVDAITTTLVQNTNAGVNAVALMRASSDTATVNFQAHASGRTATRWGITLGDWTELLAIAGDGLAVGTLGNTPLILGTNGTNRMQIAGAGGVTVTGNFTVSGGTKNFAMVDPADSRKAIYFAALEGPEAGTYIRGTAKTSNGEVVIQLPGYFARATENERMTVQLTPVGGWSQVYVAEKSPERLVVRVAPGGGDLEFDYLVQGVRKGFLDYQVERVNDLPE